MAATTYPFDSIHAALSWFFNRAWVKPPARPRSLDLVRYQYSPTRDDPEIVAVAFWTIRAALKRFCTAREHCILYEHYRKRGATQAEVAVAYDLSGGDRSVRYIRDKVLARIEAEFTAIGIVRIPKPGEKKYARHETVEA